MGLAGHLGHEHRRRDARSVPVRRAARRAGRRAPRPRTRSAHRARRRPSARHHGRRRPPATPRRRRARSACAGSSTRRSPRRGRARPQAPPGARRRSGRRPTRRARLGLRPRRRRPSSRSSSLEGLSARSSEHTQPADRGATAIEPAGWMVTTSAPRATSCAEPEIDDWSTLDHGVVADHDADLGRADRGQRGPVAVERRMRVVGKDGEIGAGALAHEPGDRLRLLACLRAREDDGDGAARLGAAPTRRRRAPSSYDTSESPRRGSRTRGAVRRSGPGGGRERSGPCRRSSRSSISGWLRERIRATLPSRVVAQVLQPTGQRPHTVGTFWISHGLARNRYTVDVSAPTGHSSTTLPEK